MFPEKGYWHSSSTVKLTESAPEQSISEPLSDPIAKFVPGAVIVIVSLAENKLSGLTTSRAYVPDAAFKISKVSTEFVVV